MSETLRTVAGRPVLRIERRLAHPPAKVWRAITEPAHLSQWYPFQATALDLQVGGLIRFEDGQGTVIDATITELEPQRVFAFSECAPDAMSRESYDLVRFELHADGVGCLLIFTHTFDDRPAAASYASGWHVCLDALEQVVSGSPIVAPGRMDALHESYIKAFGLAEGRAEETPEGWRVRFERQLVRPIAAVWAMLSGAPDHRAPAIGEQPPPGFTTGQVPAGAVTAVEAPALLEYGWLAAGRPAGHVRWELSNGTGHGARLVLTQSGPRELAESQATALRAWQAQIERLAAQLLASPAGLPHLLGTRSPAENGRTALRFERRLAHPPEKVWRAITAWEHLRQWFPAVVEFDLTPGAKLRFRPTPEQQRRFGVPEDQVTYGAVTRADPPHLLEYTWGQELLRWELRADGDGACHLVFTNILDSGDVSPDLAAGWHAGLDVVEAQLDGREIDWSVWHRAEHLRDDYVGSFGG